MRRGRFRNYKGRYRSKTLRKKILEWLRSWKQSHKPLHLKEDGMLDKGDKKSKQGLDGINLTICSVWSQMNLMETSQICRKRGLFRAFLVDLPF